MSGSSDTELSEPHNEEEEDADYDPNVPEEDDEEETAEVVEDEHEKEEISISNRCDVVYFKRFFLCSYMYQNTFCSTKQAIKNYR